MTGAVRVVFAFVSFGKSGQTAILANSTHPIASAGKDFVPISLVGDIPDNLILRQVKDIVECNRQFDSAQTGGQMPACF